MAQLSHFDDDGHVHMVNVGDKPVTKRVAIATGEISMQPETLVRIVDQNVAKGNVLELARVAGVMASKRTSDLIPLCHPLGIDAVEIEIVALDQTTIRVAVKVSTEGKTGVEMEALTSVSVACLTIYDMCKAIDRSMTIGPIQLQEKSGGKSGHYKRKDQRLRPTSSRPDERHS